MTLWRTARSEVAGAWRSLRYDLSRRGAYPRPYAEVTCPQTFGRAGVHRRPGRPVAVAAFGTLAVAGAAGGYFAVVNGVGPLTGEAGTEPYPLAAAAPEATHQELAHEELGTGAPRKPAPPPAATIRVVPTTAATTSVPRQDPTTSPAPRGTTVAHPVRTTVAPLPCDCLTPPVPTPTFAPPYSPSGTPTETAEPSQEPGLPEPSATDSDPESPAKAARRARPE
ncbi:hypothetical protein [Actinoplanes sp. N902-109]|uniref:hypothetical protein n=1 Tax=Actinoplanes sp. (strain N902-109) TaxID=649831 RepID=UPI0003293B4A|nr:hypothetical protein [Actinoplanes sp. N902-109]AGL15472.1 hypothetical protein L083_1962 [Actinoplanes sp. N902-109]